MNKNYIVSSVVVGIALSLALVAPALASAATPGNWGVGVGANVGVGVGMGHGQMKPGVSGKVSAINGTTLTVVNSRNNTTYSVDASSATVTKDGASSSVSSIAVGDMVMAQGTLSGTNLAASKVFDGMGGGMMRGNGVFGTVASVSGNTLTVTSKMGPNSTATPTTYTVNASSATITKDGATSLLTNVAVGDMVMVEGTVSGTNVTATAIRDGMPKGGAGMMGGEQNPVIAGNGEPVVAGTVTTINGNTITITNKSNVTYSVDATNAKVSENNTVTTLSNIVVGENVVVQGTVNGNSVTATSIMGQKMATATTAKPSFMGGIVNFFKHVFGF